MPVSVVAGETFWGAIMPEHVACAATTRTSADTVHFDEWLGRTRSTPLDQLTIFGGTGIRHPDKAQELPAGWVPLAGEQPLHCLLDDDRLISRVNVDTDRLLDPHSPDEVALTIRVRVRASTAKWASASLIS